MRCDFSQHNASHLLAWQEVRGAFSDQRRALTFGSLAELKQRCHGRAGWSRGSSVRAVKTIRMKGQLASFAEACRELAGSQPRLNVSCVIVQLVRHPLTTQQSQRPFQQATSSASRNHNRNDFAAAPPSNATDALADCRLVLQDVRAAQALQAERKQLEEAALASGSAAAFAALAALPRVTLVKYDEVVSAPEATARAVHAMLRARTGPTKLAGFLLGHMRLNRSLLSAELRRLQGRHASPPPLPPAPGRSPSPSSQGSAESPRGTVPRSAFSTVRQPRACEATDAMAQWPACAELVRRLHPLYVC